MRRLTRLLVDAVNENVDALPRRLHDLGVRFNREQEEEFRLELREIYYRYHGASIGEIDPLELIREAFIADRPHAPAASRPATRCSTRRWPRWAASTAELYPDFNVFEVAEPYAARADAQPALAQRRCSSAAARRRRTTAACCWSCPTRCTTRSSSSATARSRCSSATRASTCSTTKADVVFNRLVIAIVMAATVRRRRPDRHRRRRRPPLAASTSSTWLGSCRALGFPGLILVLSILRSGRSVKTGSDPVSAHVLACNKGV